MGMDRRLGPGSKPLRNQCRGAGVQAQVSIRVRNLCEGAHNHSFSLSQLQIPLELVLFFNLQKNAEREEDKCCELSTMITSQTAFPVLQHSTAPIELPGSTQKQTL